MCCLFFLKKKKRVVHWIPNFHVWNCCLLIDTPPGEIRDTALYLEFWLLRICSLHSSLTSLLPCLSFPDIPSLFFFFCHPLACLQPTDHSSASPAYWWMRFIHLSLSLWGVGWGGLWIAKDSACSHFSTSLLTSMETELQGGRHLGQRSRVITFWIQASDFH